MRVFVNASLGVSSKKLLKDPSTCLRYGRHVGNVSNALSFAEWYLNAKDVNKLRANEIEHLAASIKTSGSSAANMVGALDEKTKEKALEYSRAAKRVYSLVAKSEKPGENLEKLKKAVGKLRVKADQLAKDVGSLCTVDLKTSVRGPVATGRPSLASRYRPLPFRR